MLFLLITLKKYRYDGVANLQCVQAIEFRSKHIVGRLILDTNLAENPPEGRKFFGGDFQLPVYTKVSPTWVAMEPDLRHLIKNRFLIVRIFNLLG